MHTTTPPTLETFDHWPSWLNARGHVDRSACFELKVSDLRRLAGCVPMGVNKKGKATRLKGRAAYGVPDLPNERVARNGKGRLSCGWYDLYAYEMNALARGQFPRRLGGDWRTGRAPAMRREVGAGARGSGPGQSAGMSLAQGGYGPGQRGYELKAARSHDLPQGGGHGGPHGVGWAEAVGFVGSGPLDAGLEGNPNRGASREKRFGLDDDWLQRVGLEKWSHYSVSGVQYFLICPGPVMAGPDASLGSASGCQSTVDARGLKGLTGTVSNCGDGSRGAHGKGWVCGQRVYKLFWVLAREDELRDALLAEQWINGLTSGQLSRRSAQVSVLIDRYGPIMGDDRMLRCRRCLRLRYGQSPEVLRKKRRARG